VTRVTSGKKLTERQADDILRLASLKREDGCWRLTYEQIAEQLGLSERTVRRWIREAAVRFGRLTGWNKSGIDL